MRNSRGSTGSAAALVIVAALAGACSLAPDPEIPPPVERMPTTFEQPDALGEYFPERWWEGWGDPTLNRVVETALDANLDLAEAIARVEEARSRHGIARAPLFPSIDGRIEASRQSQPANTGIGGQFRGEDGAPGDGQNGQEGQDGQSGDAPPGEDAGQPGPAGFDRFEFTTYTASLGLSYELDFWGRVRNDAHAAWDDLLATTSGLQTARLQVIAATISTYLEVRELDRRLALTRESADLLAERAELTEDRYRRGLVSSFELYSIRGAFRSAESAVPTLESRLYEAKGRLAVLLGRYAGQIDDLLEPAGEVDPDPGPVPASLPAELLIQRPDVRSAALRLEAERHRIGARRAALFPSVPLSAALGLQADEPSGLTDTDQWFSSFAGSLLQPIFRGGRLRNQVDAARARYEQRAAAYARTVLTAFKEVEASYREMEAQRRRLAILTDRVDAATDAVDLQRQRFLRGVGDYLAYLDARRDLSAAETEHAGAERGLAEARLGVHRSLGGAWVEEPETARAAVRDYLDDARSSEAR